MYLTHGTGSARLADFIAIFIALYVNLSSSCPCKVSLFVVPPARRQFGFSKESRIQLCPCAKSCFVPPTECFTDGADIFLVHQCLIYLCHVNYLIWSNAVTVSKEVHFCLLAIFGF